MSLFKFQLTDTEIVENLTRFMEIVDTFDDRSDKLRRLYSDYGEVIALVPASSYEHYHNAMPGGYIDHVLRVMNYATDIYHLWKASGIDVSNFTLEELLFAAMHHDLGKLGDPGDGCSRYVPNTSSWHYENLGRCYEYNGAIPHLDVPDRALFILQKYQIPVSMNETLGIKLTDGLYDKANESYLMAKAHNSRLRTHLPHILHHADMMATQFEYDRWSAVAGDRGFAKLKG